MCDLLSHRGPDDRGIFYANNVALGHRRLSIIDLEGGHQPIHNEEGNIWVVFNGEIYNHLKLKRDLEKKGHIFSTNSDTEVLVHSYEDNGVDFSKKLDGMFAFALWDNEKKILLLSRDRIGKKPLYYSKTKDGFLFASEIKAILEYENIDANLNYDVLSHYFSYRSTPNTETLFKGIKKVPPSSTLCFNASKSKISIIQYYNLNEKYDLKDSTELDFIRIIQNTLVESVKKRLMSDVPIGAYLSGGIDSSAIVGIASKYHNEQLKTFSVGFGASTDEIEMASKTADYFCTDHHELFVDSKDISNLLPKMIWHLDEPIADPAIIPTYLMSKLTKKYVSVVLTGEGADELFGGYPKYKLFSSPFNFIPHDWKYKMYMYSPPSNVFDQNEKDKLFLNDQFKINKHQKEVLLDCSNYEINDLLRKDVQYWLPNYLLMKVDKMTMAHGLEARAPFLDNRLIELSFNIPSSFKVRNLTGKYILRKSMADILPKNIINRKKRGFPMPLNEWMTGDLNELLIQKVSDSEIINGLFNKNYISAIIKGRKSVNPIKSMRMTNQAWLLLNFSIWYEIFIEKKR
jgi:asparagine synthase (glutamine-hydrolysing)